MEKQIQLYRTIFVEEDGRGWRTVPYDPDKCPYLVLRFTNQYDHPQRMAYLETYVTRDELFSDEAKFVQEHPDARDLRYVIAEMRNSGLPVITIETQNENNRHYFD